MATASPIFPYKTSISESYKRNYVLYLTAAREGKLTAGQVRARVAGMDDLIAEGTLNGPGYLSGMAKLYHELTLKNGDEVSYRVLSPSEIEVQPPRDQVSAQTPVAAATTATTTTTPPPPLRKNIHFEAFRPENLFNWTPQAEVDVYMAFGVLEEYTDLKYCCGVNAEVLRKLGVQIEPKPDAILIDRVTDEYLIAEFEVYSSKYGADHKPGDVDVLVCWEHDETDKNKVPKRVLSLAEKAREAAIAQLQPEE